MPVDESMEGTIVIRCLLLILGLIFLITIAIGVPESHIVGPYNVSYDLGNPAQSTVRLITNASNLVSLNGTLYDAYGLLANTSVNPSFSVYILKYQTAVDFLTDDYVKSLFYGDFKNSIFNAIIHRKFDGYDGYLVTGTYTKDGRNVYFGLYKIKNDTVVKLGSVAPMTNETGRFFKTIHVEDLTE